MGHPKDCGGSEKLKHPKLLLPYTTKFFQLHAADTGLG